MRRALHFVFKVADRYATSSFYRNVLGMKVLRHEEFEKGCEATCNGPYDGKWSKSMVGYGAEDTHFVVELTYNYGIGAYKLGNDFHGITLYSSQILANAKTHGWPVHEQDKTSFVEAPGGYRFFIEPKVPKAVSADPVHKVSLSTSDLQASMAFWLKVCGMTVFHRSDKSALLGFSQLQCCLELVKIDSPVERATAFGRIAFSCAESDLAEIEAAVRASGQKVLTPLTRLPTPGKATVTVVIVADPDGHEICFVGDEAFRQLSQVDPAAETLLEDALAADGSAAWFAKKGKSKAEAE